MAAGDIYTIAGGGSSGLGNGNSATSALLYEPQAVAVDAGGNVLIADTEHDQVRVVAETSADPYNSEIPAPWTVGYIYDVAGGGSANPGDGGPATSAEIILPEGVAVDAAGNLVITGSDDGRIQVVAATAGTYYGQAIGAGDIDTVAGGGTANPGNGGPATSASLNFPQGATPDSNGTLIIADTGRNRVQVIGPRVPWHISPGGYAKATAAKLQFKDTTTGTVTQCASATLSATLKTSTARQIGKITAGSFTGCTIGTIAVKIAASDLPWDLNATGYNTTTGVTTATITGIDLAASATGCTATLDGTAAGAGNGTVKVTYTNATGKLVLQPKGDTLHAWGVSGCLGLISNGDPTTPAATTTISPKQTITGP
jgi:NHL repeat